MTAVDDSRRNVVLVIIAHELYIMRKDKEEIDREGDLLDNHPKTWQNVDRPHIVKKIEELRKDLKI